MTAPVKQCGYSECNNELKGRKQRFCSDKCRMAQTRTVKPEQTKVEQPKPEQVSALKSDKPDYSLKLWHEQVAGLPRGVVKPKCKQDPYNLGPNPKEDDDWDGRWQSSVKYMLTIHVLLNHTVDELKEMNAWIPCWKHLEAA